MAKKAPRFKFPKHIVVMGRKIKIKQTPGPLFIANSQVFGYYDDSAGVIVVSTDPQILARDVWHTLFHEIFHAFEYRMGFARSGQSSEMREVLAECFAALMLDCFELKKKKG